VKTIASLFGFLFAIALSVSAFAAPAGICPQVVQSIKISAEAVTKDTRSYWTHRRNFTKILYDPVHLNSPGAPQLAEQEKIQADKLKTEIQRGLASLLELNAMARAQRCLSSPELATTEAAIKLAKRVNLDMWPHYEYEG
jgi:hypothetical protein